MSGRTAEIIEAVLLLHSLGKPDELIRSQLDLTAAEVAAIIKTGQIPVRQKTLFTESSEPQKNRPESSSWERVVQACKIHPAGKLDNQQT